VLPPNRISSPLIGWEAGESESKPPESAQLSAGFSDAAGARTR
jgi:hypothetical protein